MSYLDLKPIPRRPRITDWQQEKNQKNLQVGFHQPIEAVARAIVDTTQDDNETLTTFWPSQTCRQRNRIKMVSRSSSGAVQSFAAAQSAARAAMGPQSQRLGNLYSRLPVRHGQRRSGYQTLTGVVEFQQEIDCCVCRAKHNNLPKPHRSHHMLCPLNTKTKGKPHKTNELGQIKRLVDKAAKERERNNKQPLSEAEKHRPGITMEDWEDFMKPRPNTAKKVLNPGKLTLESLTGEKLAEGRMGEISNGQSVTVTELRMSAENFKKEILHRVTHGTFNGITCPKTMHALASFMQEACLGTKRDTSVLSNFFDGMEFCVPACATNTCALYDSFSRQKLLVVDWELFFPGEVLFCPLCNGKLHRTRSNFSKNKCLFPLFGSSGPPRYAIVMHYRCSACKTCFQGNEGRFLAKLPPWMAMAYPVEPKYARGMAHLTRDATHMLEHSMLTYGNGDYFSRMIYSGINTDYKDRQTRYYSFCASTGQKSEDYPKKDGEWLVNFPPQGDTIRQLYDDAASSNWNWWGLSDHDRHTREMQMVRCERTFANDHTHQTVKNYPSACKAKALFDVANEKGEIACAILVENTKIQEVSHAVEQLARRPWFCPKAMYTDTWPSSIDFWVLIWGDEVKGCLGLFHFLQRIVKTLRPRHIDYGRALRDLKMALYEYNDEDMNNVLQALKEGKMSSSKKQYTEGEIQDLLDTPEFGRRYGKYIRKMIRSKEVIIAKLEEFKVTYKVTASPGKPSARGRRDPRTNQPLFTEDTHLAIENCKQKAVYLSDPLPLEDMYLTVAANKNSRHSLPEYIAVRGESKLESFHDNLANFANCGMRESLADNLNLQGTAHYNLTIRFKHRLLAMTLDERSLVPAGWECVVPYWNHTELRFINEMAVSSGSQQQFQWVENLPEDTGERFFSEYLAQQSRRKLEIPKHPLNDRCQCCLCAKSVVRLPHDKSFHPPPAPTLSTLPPVQTVQGMIVNPYRKRTPSNNSDETNRDNEHDKREENEKNESEDGNSPKSSPNNQSEGLLCVPIVGNPTAVESEKEQHVQKNQNASEKETITTMESGDSEPRQEESTYIKNVGEQEPSETRPLVPQAQQQEQAGEARHQESSTSQTKKRMREENQQEQERAQHRREIMQQLNSARFSSGFGTVNKNDRITSTPARITTTNTTHAQQELTTMTTSQASGPLAQTLLALSLLMPNLVQQQHHAATTTWMRPTPRNQRQFCCPKYFEYFENGKRGRPHHNKDCPNKNTKKP